MRWTMLAVGLLLVCADPRARSQTKEIQDKIDKALEEERRKEAKLEDLLQRALKSNPDIRLAEARLQESEAQLAKVRLEVLQKVVMTHQQIKSAEASLEEAKARLQRVKAMFERKAVAAEELHAAEFVLQKHRAELEMARAALPALIGQAPADVRGVGFVDPGATKTPTPEMVRRVFLDLLGRLPTTEEAATALREGHERLIERLLRDRDVVVWDTKPDQGVKVRAFLDATMTVDFTDVSGEEALQYLRDRSKGVNIIQQCDFGERTARLQLKEPVPVGAILQWFEDTYPVRFVLRDYGVVAAARDSVPPGAVSVLHFWKAAKKEKTPAKTP